MKCFITGLFVTMMNLFVFAQNNKPIKFQENGVLDGVYVMESIKNPLVIDSLYSYHQSDLFITKQRIVDSLVRYNDPYYSRKKKRRVKEKFNRAEAPIELEECLYFQPVYQALSNSRTKESLNQFYLDFEKLDTISILSKIVLPNALRFYLDTAKVSLQEGTLKMILEEQNESDFSFWKESFYMKKTEVTNAEYREFTNYVRDSIARRMLFLDGMDAFGHFTDKLDENGEKEIRLNWKFDLHYWDPNIVAVLTKMYLPKYYYMWKEFDVSKFNFKMIQEDSVFEVNVYPDTLSWMHDTHLSMFNSPFCNMNYWHPAYDNLPVVGVSYFQAKAFLQWKTKKQQQELDHEGEKYTIEYSLPKEYQWEMISTMNSRKKLDEFYPSDYRRNSDASWMTSLTLDGQDTITHRSSGEKENYLLFRIEGGYDPIEQRLDGDYYNFNKYTKLPYRKSLTYFKELKKLNTISNLEGIVSEWLDESYQKNWLPMYSKRKDVLKLNKGRDLELLSQLEGYFDSKNDPNGYLVRGSNWYNDLYTHRLGGGTNPFQEKIFLDPSKQKATVGFRYVVKVSEK